MSTITTPKSLTLYSSKQSSSFPKPNTHVNLRKNNLKPCCIHMQAVSNSTNIIVNDSFPDQLRVEFLSESLPYIQKLRGKIIVVKYGGAAIKSAELKASVVKDVVLLSCMGLRPVLVHGGGPEINAFLDKLDIPAHFHDGLRVTDVRTMEVVSMVLVDKVNKDLVSRINSVYPSAAAVGLSGMDGCLLTARPTPNAAQLGFVGEVACVDPTIF